jgi:hypothetical protein
MPDRIRSILFTPPIPEVDNPEVEASPQPEPVHHTDHLEGEHVLPKVISYLRMRKQHEIHQTKPLFRGGGGDFLRFCKASRIVGSMYFCENFQEEKHLKDLTNFAFNTK